MLQTADDLPDTATLATTPQPYAATLPATSLRDASRAAGGDLPPGTKIGPYTLDAWLARGGFGDVYRAVHEESREPRALKVLHAELASSRAAILRFEREVEAIQRVSHPHVIAVEAFGQLTDGRPWFSMELLAGSDLAALLATGGRLAPADALAVLTPLCDALDAIHAQGIVHRDLKPSNVFLAEQDGVRRVVLLDFGVARLLDDRGPGLTASLQTIGTPAYMAPEQIRSQPVTHRADIYALGALVHAVLTGEAPFSESPDPVAQLQLHLHTKPPRVSSRAPVDPAFDEVVARAMSKQPAHRHASARAFLDDFRRALGARVEAPAPSGAPARAGAIYVSVRLDDASLDEPDDRLLAELDELLPHAADSLARRGLRKAIEVGNGALFLLDFPADPDAEREARARLLTAALDVHEGLSRRPGRDDRIALSVCVHAGAIDRDERGADTGELLDLAAWVPEPPPEGALATPAALAGSAFASAARDASGMLRFGPR